mmetsp:Transcript_177385/g.568797  ORF Transcript_177385/g.568797 Transcript_177385/m.568797 type:complete len:312 (+) Transcript_177385:932-1867(+)
MRRGSGPRPAISRIATVRAARHSAPGAADAAGRTPGADPPAGRGGAARRRAPSSRWPRPPRPRAKHPPASATAPRPRGRQCAHGRRGGAARRAPPSSAAPGPRPRPPSRSARHAAARPRCGSHTQRCGARPTARRPPAASPTPVAWPPRSRTSPNGKTRWERSARRQIRPRTACAPEGKPSAATCGSLLHPPPRRRQCFGTTEHPSEHASSSGGRAGRAPPDKSWCATPRTWAEDSRSSSGVPRPTARHPSLWSLCAERPADTDGRRCRATDGWRSGPARRPGAWDRGAGRARRRTSAATSATLPNATPSG